MPHNCWPGSHNGRKHICCPSSPPVLLLLEYIKILEHLDIITLPLSPPPQTTSHYPSLLLPRPHHTTPLSSSPDYITLPLSPPPQTTSHYPSLLLPRLHHTTPLSSPDYITLPLSPPPQTTSHYPSLLLPRLHHTTPLSSSPDYITLPLSPPPQTTSHYPSLLLPRPTLSNPHWYLQELQRRGIALREARMDKCCPVISTSVSI